MNTKSSFFLLLVSLVLLCFFSCEKKDDTSLVCPPPTTAKIYFEGIFLTDQNGSPIGGGDTEDWKTDDTWTQQEYDLFDNNDDSACPNSAQQEFYPVYPNPNNGIFSLSFQNEAVSDLSIRFVDQDFQIIQSQDFLQVAPGSNTYSFNFQNLNLNDTIRLYYKNKQSDCAFRGHGDILIIP